MSLNFLKNFRYRVYYINENKHTKHILVRLDFYLKRKKILCASRNKCMLTYACVHAKLLQSHPTLCDPMSCSPPGPSVHGDSPGQNTGVGGHALLQGIFPPQGSNPCLLWLLHCRQILHCWATGEAHVTYKGLKLGYNNIFRAILFTRGKKKVE